MFRLIRTRKHKGQAMAEFALLLPMLLTLVLGGADFARAFSAYVEVGNMAREAAHYASQTLTTADVTNPLNKQKIIQTALDEAGWSSGPDVSVTPTQNTETYDGLTFHYVKVTVNYKFHPLFPVPPIPSSITMHRTVRMRVLQE
jgi:Flp pilus assembly protein TadG